MSPLRILIVDDSDVTRRILKVIVRSRHWSTVDAVALDAGLNMIVKTELSNLAKCFGGRE